MPSDPLEIARQVDGDVRDRLGQYFEPDGGQPSSIRIETFGDDGVVSGASSDETRRFTFVRWRWQGRHVRDIPARIGDADMVQATGNPVEVEGLTVVEERPDES